MSKGNTIEIFKSPIRKSHNKTESRVPLSEYVDYTPRRPVASSVLLNLDSPPATNSITYARERRAYFYHQLAKEAQDSLDDADFMNSPVVRRHFGVSEHVAPAKSFDEKIQQALDIELLSKKNEWVKSDFDVETHLGTGKFGAVYKAREIQSNQTVAIKILKKHELEAATVVPFLKREIEIQAHLNHPNIVRLYGYFQDKEHIYLVLEYAGENDLYSVLAKNSRLSEVEAIKYIVAIADALKYMHKLGVLHRDIKLENILIAEDGTLKIADFGWAVYDPKPRRNTFCGTLDYLPPEMIQNKTHGHSVDVWALGVLCYELLVGGPPFVNPVNPQNQNHEETYNRIIKADIVFPKHISPGAKSFILKLLQRNPIARLNISDIQNDPWIKSHTSKVNYSNKKMA